jgi:taurine transport system ATP-binding protein
VSKLSIKNVGASYKARILDDISFEVNAGEFVVFVGPSGCGKTSLLNFIAGFNKPHDGSITLDEKLITGPGSDRGVVFQQDALLPWLNIIENVAFGLELKGVARSDREARAKEVLALVDLAGFEQHKVWELSGGMKQRASLARALAANPQILLMDEPFGALDAFTREQMQALILKVWHKTGKQVLLVTHDIEEAVFLASELVLMTPRPGRIVERIKLDFGARFAKGESARHIKSDPKFIEIREYVLSHFFTNRDAVNEREYS